VYFRRTRLENGSRPGFLSGTTRKTIPFPAWKYEALLEREDETPEKADFIWKKGNPALSCHGIFP
jgi:hypothetical protein